MPTFIGILMFLCATIIETSTLLFAADNPHPPNPKLESAQSEQTRPPTAAPQTPQNDHHTPALPSAQKEQEQKEQHCANDFTLANCEPPSGSPLSASPLASKAAPTVQEPQE